MSGWHTFTFLSGVAGGVILIGAAIIFLISLMAYIASIAGARKRE